MKIDLSSEMHKNEYTTDKIKSYHFSFKYSLILLFTFILYWFVVCPFIFICIYQTNITLPNWTTYFWVLALCIFLISLLLLLCLWNIEQKKNSAETTPHIPKIDKNKKLYTITVNKKPKDNVPLQEDKIYIPLKPLNCEQVSETPLNNVLRNSDKMFPRCSVRVKEECPKSVSPEECKSPIILSQENSSTPLSPRESFFNELFENADTSTSSITYNFDEREKSDYDSMKNPRNEESSKTIDFDTSGTPSLDDCTELTDTVICFEHKEANSLMAEIHQEMTTEYFIANVSKEDTITSEAFIFVDDAVGKESGNLEIVIPNVLVD